MVMVVVGVKVVMVVVVVVMVMVVVVKVVKVVVVMVVVVVAVFMFLFLCCKTVNNQITFHFNIKYNAVQIQYIAERRKFIADQPRDSIILRLKT